MQGHGGEGETGARNEEGGGEWPGVLFDGLFLLHAAPGTRCTASSSWENYRVRP